MIGLAAVLAERVDGSSLVARLSAEVEKATFLGIDAVDVDGLARESRSKAPVVY